MPTSVHGDLTDGGPAPAPERRPRCIGDIAARAIQVDWGMTALELEELFQSDSALSSVLISNAVEPGRVGLVTRLSFFEAMTGRLGYGRLVQHRRPVRAIASWDAVAMPHDATLHHASSILLAARDGQTRRNDIVVAWPDGSMGTVAGAAVFEELALQYGYDATHDLLTGLPNRVLLLDRLSMMLEHSKRSHTPVALLFCDLDGFKRINDSLGHEIGDCLLREVAQRFGTAVRAEDTLARLGGDEFVVACELPSEAGAVQLAERLIDTLTTPVMLKGHQVRVTTSVGIAFGHGTGVEAGELVRNADVAMYRAKTDRRSGFEVFDAVMHSRTLERLLIEQSLGPAMARDEFRLYYQPVVTAEDRRVVALEALVRWELDGGRVRPPLEFIGAAEETGFILTLGAWVLGEACRQLAEWREAHAAGCMVAVNVSARQLIDPGLPGYVEALLGACRLGPDSLVLEITESHLMQNVQSSLEILFALRGLGARITIDDFGTGYSSLSYLARIPLDSLKIDKSFIANLESDGTSRMLVATVVNLAANLGVRSVAEGVETEGQFSILREMGCDLIQGYLIGRPQPPADVPGTWLDAGLADPSP